MVVNANDFCFGKLARVNRILIPFFYVNRKQIVAIKDGCKDC